jgi:alpha-methylacyl-CoA racemase
MAGPLSGIKVVEFAGIGPAPFCGMMLADAGADVVRIDKKGAHGIGRFDVLGRGRRSIALDLKDGTAQAVAMELVARAEVLIEGFRPGVMERLNLGPDLCLARNPRLVYGRMTGWGQTGPLAQSAGHDINYIALSGMLHAIGRPGEPPPPPLNLVGDFGGGAMMLAFGIVCALLEARGSQQGQIIDAAMIEGSALLGSMMFGLKAAGRWTAERGANLLDGAAPFYDTYECADGKFIALGALEPQFYAELMHELKLSVESPRQMDSAAWREHKKALAAIFRTQTRDEWCRRYADREACVAPVLDMDEAPLHPQHEARNSFITVGGVVQPAPVPRFSRTPTEVTGPPPELGEHAERVLDDWGFPAEYVAQLKASGVI